MGFRSNICRVMKTWKGLISFMLGERELCVVYAMVNGECNYVQVQTPHSDSLMVMCNSSSVRNQWQHLAHSPLVLCLSGSRNADFLSPFLTQVLLTLFCVPHYAFPSTTWGQFPSSCCDLSPAFRIISTSLPGLVWTYTENKECILTVHEVWISSNACDKPFASLPSSSSCLLHSCLPSAHSSAWPNL